MSECTTVEDMIKIKPPDWGAFELKKILKEEKKPVPVIDEKKYKLISVKRRNGGISDRETLLGKNILTKKLNLLLPDTFLIAKMQISHGACAYVPANISESYISDSYVSYKSSDTSILYLPYLNLLAQTKALSNSFLRSSHGVHIEKMTFNPNDWLKNKIALPSIVEQKKITQILSSLDKVIRLSNLEIQKLTNLKKGMLQQLLTKGIGHGDFKDSPVGKIPSSWSFDEIGNLINLDTEITYGIVQAGPHVHNGVPYIKTGDMTGSDFDISSLQKTSVEIAKKFKRSSVREGDIVCAIRAIVGKVLVVPKALNGANLTQGTAKISFRDEIGSRYGFWAMQSPFVEMQYKIVTKGTTFQEITLADLRKIVIAIPPKQESNKLVKALDGVDTKLKLKLKKHNSLLFLKKGLMNDLLTGKVRAKI